MREIVRIKREGGGKEGGDLIIYRKQAVPHLSLLLSRWRHTVAGVWRRERGLFPPVRRGRTRCCTRTLKKQRGRETLPVLLLTAANSPLSPCFGDLDKYDSIQFVTHQSLILHCQEFIISRLACAIKMHLLISAHWSRGWTATNTNFQML